MRWLLIATVGVNILLSFRSHLASYRDADDRLLMGDGTYKLHLPKDIPAKDFWPVTVYHPYTRSLLQNGKVKPSVSTYDDPDVKADGSVDVWFAPDHAVAAHTASAATLHRDAT